MDFFYALASLKAIFLGAVYGRLDGGGITSTHEWIERSLIMFFFVLACAPFAGYWSLLAYLGVIGIATGHGQYFLNLKNPYPQKEFKERVDPFVSLLFGPDWRAQFDSNHDFTKKQIKKYEEIKGKIYWRNVFGMFCTGALVGLPAAALAVTFSQYIVCGLFLMTGPAKSISYAISDKLGWGYVGGEYINGALRNAICVAAIIYQLT